MKKNLGIIIAIIIVVILGLAWWMTKEPVSNTPNQTTNTTNTENVPTETKKSGFTVADVATHNSATDCYTIVGDKVYGLTDWISKHPGGEKAILGLCGVNATEAFTKQHGTFQQAKDALAGYLIGDLVQ